jgi:hypothetical protein
MFFFIINLKAIKFQILVTPLKIIQVAYLVMTTFNDEELAIFSIWQ